MVDNSELLKQIEEARQKIESLESEFDLQIQEMSDLYEEVATLYRMGELIGATLNINEMQQSVLNMAAETIESPAAMLFQSVGYGMVVPTAYVGIDVAKIYDVELDDKEPLLKYVSQNKRTIIVNNFADDRRFDSHFFRKLNLNKTICSPLFIGDNIFGLICLCRYEGDKDFTAGNGKLLTSLANQSANILENIRLHQRELEQKQMEEQIRTAKLIQMELLPKEPPAFKDIEVYGYSIPAREIGGDYFDFVPLGDSKFGVVISDVAGKGLPAGLLMAMTKGSFRAYTNEHTTPAQTLDKVNRLMFSETTYDRFVTMLYIVYDAEKKIVSIGNAGHDPLLHYSKATDEITQIPGECLPLGIKEDEDFIDQYVEVAAGDLFVLFTDGFSEAMDASMQQFKISGIIDVVTKHIDQKLGELADTLYTEANKHMAGVEQYDDMTLVLMRIK